ncbi:hypothetical protein GCM10027057_25580 [Marisediminicola antarctica]|nr:hypothetical protein [Marisediminicola antarctica]
MAVEADSTSAIPHSDRGNRGPIPGFLEIHQSFWSVNTRLYTEQSSSKSTATTWLPSYESLVDNLTFMCDNMPKVSESHINVRSSGACNLMPASLTPTEIEGSYFTDRFTKGDVVLTFVDRSTGYASFAAATTHVESGASG